LRSGAQGRQCRPRTEISKIDARPSKPAYQAALLYTGCTLRGCFLRFLWLLRFRGVSNLQNPLESSFPKSTRTPRAKVPTQTMSLRPTDVPSPSLSSDGLLRAGYRGPDSGVPPLFHPTTHPTPGIHSALSAGRAASLRLDRPILLPSQISAQSVACQAFAYIHTKK
jgi:hypothetical protein